MQNNKVLAFELARHFLVHLKEEVKKSPKLIDTVGFDNKKPRHIHEEVTKRMLTLFPELETSTLPTRNIFVEWGVLNNFTIAYENFSFEAYNLIFAQRIEEMFERTNDSKVRFHNETIEVFEKFDSDRKGFSVSFFIRSENNMREIIRSIIDQCPQIGDKQATWDLAFEQSKEYQEVVNEFFEQVLKNAIEKSDRLLDNILPSSISEELKNSGRVQPVSIKSATVLFTDFKGFTQLSSTMSPEALIRELDRCFSVFDRITEKYGLEKIKTIGDSYMCAAGIPQASGTHHLDAALASLSIRHNMAKIRSLFATKNKAYWEVRIGFHTGPLVAGVIGKKKFSYDIWGDTVNTASRMESSGEAGKINISQAAYELLDPYFVCESRGEIEAKGKGKLPMYFLEGLKPEYAKDAQGLIPNQNFVEAYHRLKHS